MSATSAQKTAPKTKRFNSDCCADPSCEWGLRNRYFFGKQLSPHSFQVEQHHALERRHLLNRAIHGWGVVYGFGIAVTPSGSLSIKPGLALDKNGRELLQVEALTGAASDLLVFDKDGKRSALDKVSHPRNGESECLLLSAHYAEQDMEEVKLNDPCHCEHGEWNYTCETVRYSLRSINCDECCQDDECELHCQCGTEGWCDKPEHAGKRGHRRCLCEYVTKLSPGSDCDSLCEIDEPCGTVRVDLCNGVPLACVKLDRNDCNEWTIREVDECGPRRLVKRNDLLFDLIQGCDLTTIIDFGWKDWHRLETPVPFDQFSQAFGPLNDKQKEYVTKDFWVEFSGPVLSDSLRPDCFAMTVVSIDSEDGWWQTYRVPILRVEKTEHRAGDLPNHVRRATIVVEGAWVEDGVRERRTLFQGGKTHIEIEVRGDFIVDCNGRTIDANANGLSKIPTGNGTPGGTFLSTFQVKAAPKEVSQQ
jgi:hypothetical protein